MQNVYPQAHIHQSRGVVGADAKDMPVTARRMICSDFNSTIDLQSSSDGQRFSFITCAFIAITKLATDVHVMIVPALKWFAQLCVISK